MSLAALNWAWNARPKTSMQKFMLIRLADRYNGDTGRCNASVARLAEELMIHTRSARRLLQQLEQQGYMTIERRYAAGHQKTNQYDLNLARVDEGVHREGTAVRGDEDQQGDDIGTPLGVTESAPLPLTESAPEPEVEPEVEPTTTLDQSSKGSEPGRMPALTDAGAYEWGRFLEIWTHYPPTRRRNKAEAWKAYRKLPPADRESAHQDVVTNRRGLKDRQWRDGFSPEPHRYLKRRQWHDEWKATDEASQRDTSGLRVSESERVERAIAARRASERSGRP